MDTESKSVSRSELQSSQTGETLVRLFEITRELRGDHTTTLQETEMAQIDLTPKATKLISELIKALEALTAAVKK